MSAKKNTIACLAVSILFWQPVAAQFYNLPADHSFSLLTEKGLAEKDLGIHGGIKPYVHFFSPRYVHVADTHRLLPKYDGRGIAASLFRKHLIHVASEKPSFKLRLDPLLNFEYGKDLSGSLDRKLYNNTRGFIASGYIGDKFYFETLLAESQSVFPGYISDNARATQVVPGQGRWKTFKTTGFDYAFSSGFISIQPVKRLNIQIGHGKQKIGNGYRSLLLSDNSFNYPYLRATQQWWNGRLQYTNIYAVLMNLEPSAIKQNPQTERLYQKKAASFQYLSLNIVKPLSVGLFQGMIWQAGDARNQQHLSWQYFNPLIYTNLISYQLNNKNNMLIGGDIKFKLSNSLNVYAQIMADDLSNTKKNGNGYGYQGGVSYFNAFGVNNLYLQAEYNHVSETSYLGPIGAVSNQSYSHYNQNLAFTPGSGTELVFIGDFKWKRFFTNVKYNNLVTVVNRNKQSTTNQFNAKIGYLINPSYNLNISAGINFRTQNFHIFNPSKQETNYIYISLKTSLYNLYYDF